MIKSITCAHLRRRGPDSTGRSTGKTRKTPRREKRCKRLFAESSFGVNCSSKCRADHYIRNHEIVSVLQGVTAEASEQVLNIAREQQAEIDAESRQPTRYRPTASLAVRLLSHVTP
jgi:hypothetical protein